jgi:hypothetical protein
MQLAYISETRAMKLGEINAVFDAFAGSPRSSVVMACLHVYSHLLLAGVQVHDARDVCAKERVLFS